MENNKQDARELNEAEAKQVSGGIPLHPLDVLSDDKEREGLFNTVKGADLMPFYLNEQSHISHNEI